DADGEPLSEEDLIARAWSLSNGEKLDFEAALRTLMLRELVDVKSGGCRVAVGSDEILAYYANLAPSSARR
ncbi:MAG TPA: hypothetical protein VFJ72_16005, partial [Rubrobacteraceae bacterium]|nr:hypothetical protein [Rubrobacteraceae bacterium]